MVKLTLIGPARIIAPPVHSWFAGNRGIAQPGSASALGAEGREFESLCPDQFLKYMAFSPNESTVLNAPVAQLDRASAF